MENIFEQKFIVELSDININFGLKSTAILKYYQETFARYCAKFNVAGYDVFKIGLKWVLGQTVVEYFDVDLERYKEEYPNIDYLVFCNNVFSRVNFSKVICRAGYMLRDIEDSGEVFEPKTVETSFTINADLKVSLNSNKSFTNFIFFCFWFFVLV